MKYVIVLGDGMADEPIEALGGKTPLEYANTPIMDELASGGEMGMTQNVPTACIPAARWPIWPSWAMTLKSTSPDDLPWRP